ncbi:MAG: hypothetical protein NC452_11285 [Eubacterium sp.]|nr:hypothetical protein [Eubacterium sp.]
MNSLRLINAIAKFKTLTKELLLLYLAANESGTFSVWVCRYNKDKRLIAVKRFTAAEEEQMLEYLRSKGVSKEAFLKVYDSYILQYFHTDKFLRQNPRLFREISDTDTNTLLFTDGSSVTECSECVIG